MPRDSRIAASDAAAMPFPSEETTPPETNTYLVIEEPGIGLPDHSPIPPVPQRAPGRENAARRQLSFGVPSVTTASGCSACASVPNPAAPSTDCAAGRPTPARVPALPY